MRPRLTPSAPIVGQTRSGYDGTESPDAPRLTCHHGRLQQEVQ